MKRTFNLVSLGCPKNLVDSEVVYGLLEKDGWLGLSEPDDAAFIVVNTCGFIQSAVEESIEEILQLAELKNDDPEKKLVVIGCLVQRYRHDLQEELPEVDLFIGTEGIPQISELLTRLAAENLVEKTVIPELFLMDSQYPRRLSTPYYRAWLKITEGCDNRCSYCMIPSIRGRLRSRQVGDLVSEAKMLDRKGVKECTFVAQDLTAYGMDLDGTRQLVRLLENLLAETTIPWFRLMYLYPSGITDELIDLVASNKRIVPYMDIPLQHVSDKVLKAMNRRYRQKDIVRLLQKLRANVPEIALRTTLLVGFPGETDDDVGQLIDFLRSEPFDHVGIFSYADEQGCPSEHYPAQVNEEEKQERIASIAEVQSQVSAELLQLKVGKVEPVLVEGVSRETDLLLEGRTRYQAPDVDGCVLINEGSASPGDILDVEITEAQIYDLVGRIV